MKRQLVGFLLLVGAALRGTVQAADPPSPAPHPELVVQVGHSNAIEALAVSPDGSLVATGGVDQTVRLWDLRAGKALRVLTGHRAMVQAVAFRPGGAQLATGDESGEVRVWDIVSGRLLRTFRGEPAHLTALTYGPDGKWLAVAGVDTAVRLWNTDTGRQEGSIATPGDIRGLAVVPGSTEMVTGHGDNTVRVWNAASGQPGPVLKGHSRAVRGISVAPGGGLAASCGFDDTVRVWDTRTGKELRRLAVQYAESVGLHPDGNTLAVGTSSGLRLWDVRSGKERHAPGDDFSAQREGARVVFSPDGKWLAASSHATLTLYLTGSETAAPRLIHWLPGNSSQISHVFFSPDGGRVASASKEIRIWDALGGRVLVRTNGTAPAAFSPDGKLLVASGFPAQGQGVRAAVHVWDAATGKELRALPDLAIRPKAVQFTPDGRALMVAAAVDGRHSTVEFWDVATGQRLRSLAVGSAVYGAALSPDGSLVAVVLAEQAVLGVQLLHAESGQVVRKFAGSPLLISHVLDTFPVGFSPDGRWVALSRTGTQPETRVWESTTGREVAVLPVGGAAAFRPDGSLLVTAGQDGRILLWDLPTGKPRGEWVSDGPEVTSVAFRGDGQRAVTGLSDARFTLWDTASGNALAHCVALDYQDQVLERQAGGIDLLRPDRDSGGFLDYVTATPDGDYLSSRDGIAWVAFRFGARVYPFDQFDLLRNRPDRVMERLGHPSRELVEAYRLAHKKRLELSGVREPETATGTRLPALSVLSPVPPATAERRIKVRVRMSGAAAPLDRLLVSVNGVPVLSGNGLSLRGGPAGAQEREVELELNQGRNLVQLSVYDRDNLESLRETAEVNCTAPAEKPNLYVVAVGVSDFGSDARNDAYGLDYPHLDAEAVADLMERRKAGFSQVHVRRIVNKDATREKILEVRELLRQSRVDDQVVLFFAGHGLRDGQGNYFYATPDVNFGDPAVRGLRYEEIEGLLEGVPARRRLVLLDTCFAGETDLAAGAPAPGAGGPAPMLKVRDIPGAASRAVPGAFELMQETFRDLRRGSGAAVIAAVSGKGFAIETGQLRHGAFTFALLEAPERSPGGTLFDLRADRNRDRVITVSELREFVSRRVEELTGGQQRPVLRRENIALDFPLF